VSKRFLIRWLLISLGLHLLAAIFSTGYQNSDEHFQILEFLNTILGGTPASALPIEYGHRIRPWLQPFLYWGPVQLLRALGIQNPFTWAFFIRLLSALIGWLSVVSLARCIPLWISDTRWQKATLIALALFWCLPALHARHSSENLSGALFLIGLCEIYRRIHSERGASAPAFLGLGLIWGLAFEARYQVGLMVAGGFFWLVQAALLKTARIQWSQLALVVAGILGATAFGTALDFLGYGHWTFAPWNYFHFNLIEDYVSSTDVSPWWDYFRRSWTESWPVLGSLTLLGMILFWIREPRHFLTWSMAPLFLVHLAIGHKETRFLFPLAHAAPLCFMLFLATPVAGRPIWQWIRERRALRWTSQGVILLNGVALLSLTFVPAAPAMRFYKSVYERSIHELYYSDGQNPYTLLGIPMYFYRPEELKLVALESSTPQGPFWYAAPSARLSAPLSDRCQAVTHSIPEIPALRNLQVLSRLRNWTLYECSALH
jgi:phosphatidylinositol glycan class B